MTVLGQEWMVANVGALIATLQGLDPALPVGALRVERRREMTDFALGDVVEVHVASAGSPGAPHAAWGGGGGGVVRLRAGGVGGEAVVRVRVADPGGAPWAGDDARGAVPALRAE